MYDEWLLITIFVIVYDLFNENSFNVCTPNRDSLEAVNELLLKGGATYGGRGIIWGCSFLNIALLFTFLTTLTS